MSIRVDVGTPPEGYKEWTTALISFHGFADLPTTKSNENKVISPEFSCFGHQWTLVLFPGGMDISVEGYVAVGLANKSNNSIEIQYGFSVRDADGRDVGYSDPFEAAARSSETKEFGVPGSGRSSWRIPNFAKQSTIMNALIDGSLTIEVRIKCATTHNKPITRFIPTNPINKNVLNLCTNAEETADVLFEVGGQQQSNDTSKKSKTTTTFYAHRLILLNSASTLYEMIGETDEDGGVTTISITDVKPGIFKHMLYYAYGGKVSKEDLMANARDIINACDKYGLVHLKLEAEATYVESNEITMDNMMDNLLYADSKNLALLNEAVMDYIVANKRDIIGKVSFDSVPGGMMTDLLTAMARGEVGDDEDSSDYNNMRVGALREMLDKKGLDVDGSRETMIALLKEHSA